MLPENRNELLKVTKRFSIFKAMLPIEKWTFLKLVPTSSFPLWEEISISQSIEKLDFFALKNASRLLRTALFDFNFICRSFLSSLMASNRAPCFFTSNSLFKKVHFRWINIVFLACRSHFSFTGYLRTIAVDY